MRALLSERLADVALGPRLAGPSVPGIVSEPLLRYRLLFVAGQNHRAHHAVVPSLRSLAHEEWLVDPTATDPQSDLGTLLGRIGVPEAHIRVFPNQPAAWAAAAGGGIAPAVEHVWTRERPAGVTPLRSAARRSRCPGT